MSEQREVIQIKEAVKEDILARPNVVGVGVGYRMYRGQHTSEMSVVVLVSQKIPKAGLDPQALVPTEVQGVRTDVIQVGVLRAQQAPTDRWRPAPGGVSLGHYKVTAGTFGAVVRDRTSGARLILSNNHVLANSNDASIGDAILQPGAYDGGRVETDVIARLERFCAIDFGTQPGTCSVASAYAAIGNALARVLGSRHTLAVMQVDPSAVNLVDAALARPLDDGDIRDDILGIGVVSGTLEAELGMAVRKSGRTTGLTTGTVTVLDATVEISYGTAQTARFEHQIVTSAMSQGGDSGSLLVAADSQQAVGLLFAGSERTTVHNPIRAVLDCLNVVI